MSEVKTPKTAPVITTVTMQDGKIVEFAGKRKMLKESTVGADGKITVRLDFINAQFREFVIPDALLAKFAAHGAEQKLGDETAGLVDVDDALLAVDELIDRLYNGEWAQRKEGSGLAGTSILARALVEVTGKTAEEIKTFLKAKSQAEKIALRNSPRVKPVVERLEAEKVAKGSAVDTDALLAELG
jgi:hypothetical protein